MLDEPSVVGGWPATREKLRRTRQPFPAGRTQRSPGPPVGPVSCCQAFRTCCLRRHPQAEWARHWGCLSVFAKPRLDSDLLMSPGSSESMRKLHEPCGARLVADVAHALLRAVSRLISTPALLFDTVCESCADRASRRVYLSFIGPKRAAAEMASRPFSWGA